MDQIIIFCAKYLVALVLLIYIVAIIQAGPKHRKQLIIALVISGISAAVMDKLASKLFYDPRPFVSHNITPLIAHAADNGFPSEHTILGMTVGFTLVFFRRKLGILALMIALVVGVARVAAHVHSPIDIIGGTIIGLLAGSIGYYAAVKITNRKKQNT